MISEWVGISPDNVYMDGALLVENTLFLQDSIHLSLKNEDTTQKQKHSRLQIQMVMEIIHLVQH